MSDFGYIALGVPSWVQENNIRSIDYNDDRQNEIYEALQWNDALNEKIWVSWNDFDHPQLGAVQIGGFVQNNDAHGVAPVETVPELAGRITPWYLVLAQVTPLVRITEAEAETVADGLYRVAATVRNVGVLDTHLTEHARSIQVNRPTPVIVTIAGEGVTLVSGSSSVNVGPLRGNQPGMAVTMYAAPWQGGTGRYGESARAEWVVRGPPGAVVTLTSGSSKAGKDRRQLRLGPHP